MLEDTSSQAYQRPIHPKLSLESDATIIAPLVFAYVLGW